MDSARLSLISLPCWLCLWGVLFRLLLLHLQPTVTPASLLRVISDLFLSPVVCRWCLFFLSEHIATPPVQISCHKKMLQMHEQCYFWLALFTSFVGFVCLTPISFFPGGHGGGPPPERQPEPQLLRPARHFSTDQQRERPGPAGAAEGGDARVPDTLLTCHQLDPAVYRVQSSRGICLDFIEKVELGESVAGAQPQWCFCF